MAGNEAPSWKSGKPVNIEQVLRPMMVRKAMSDKRKFDIFHPSAWGYCLRKIAYQYYNEKEHFLPADPMSVDCRMERIFDTGHYTHARWQKYLADAAIVRGYWKCKCGAEYGKDNVIGTFSPAKQEGWKCRCGEKKLEYGEILVKSPPEYNFEGHCDAVVDFRGSEYEQHCDADVFVVDFKSIKDSMYSELTEPKHEHVIQVHIYMWLLGLRAGVILYENKDCCMVKEMYVPRDEVLVEKIKRQAVELKAMLANRKVPLRSSDMSRFKFPCKGCEFLGVCYQ